MIPDLRYRHTWAEIHLDHIEHNIGEIKKRLPPQCKFMAAVKADAYGHGSVHVANSALKAGADQLAAGILSEAVHLRKNGVTVPILVLTPALPSDVDIAADYNISLPVFQAEWLKEMRKYKRSTKPLRVHIKMDTGMGRIGIGSKSQFIEMVPLLRAEDIIVEGVYTHFSTANRKECPYYYKQVQRFAEMREWLAESGFHGVAAHCANSAAALQYPHMCLDMVRVGASLYGIHTCEEEVRRCLPVTLQPALSLHTELVHVKQLKKNDYVGYDMSYAASEDEWIGTLPIGYADGYFRSFQGFHVLVDGHKASISGKICMDQTMIRLPKYYPPGTRVTLIGRQGSREITLDDLAGHMDSIPQQIVTMISARIPKVYVDRGQIVDIDEGLFNSKTSSAFAPFV